MLLAARSSCTVPADRPYPHPNNFIVFFCTPRQLVKLHLSVTKSADQGDGTMTYRADHDGTTTRRVDQKAPSLRAFYFGVVL